MPVKVTVVVPVFNPGEYIDPLINSLLTQSMPKDEFEIVFVDDGSTDETPDRLDRLAEQHANVKTIHIPNSGWPGRPRNVGIDNSSGEYIQFVDHDDELAPTALERLYAYAKENDSDVVVGKEVRRTAGWGVVGATFDVNRPRANPRTAPLLGVMTPHKMFRRALLDQHGIRFHEGPRRMEDHPFVLEAFLRADVISVLADQPIYYWNRRPDKGNAGAQKFDWVEYYTFMRDTLDVIDRLAEPDEFRERLLAFYFESKGLGAIARSVSHGPRDAVRRHFDALRELADERFPPEVDAHLKGMVRARAQLVRSGDFEGMVSLAQLENNVRVHVELLELEVDTDARLRVRVRTGYHDEQGRLALESVDGRVLWRPRVDLKGVSEDAFDVTSAHRNRRIELALRNRRTAEVVLVPGVAEPTTGAGGRMLTDEDVTFTVDPEEAAFGHALDPGLYDVFVRIRMAPWRRQTRLPSPLRQERAQTLGMAAWTGRAVVPFSTRADNVALDVDQTRYSVLTAAMSDPPAARLDRNGTEARLSINLPGLNIRSGSLHGRLRLESEAGDAVLRTPLLVVEDEQGLTSATAQLGVVTPGSSDPLKPGRWRVKARVGDRLVDLRLFLAVGRRGGMELTTAEGVVLAGLEPVDWWRLGRQHAQSAVARVLRSLSGGVRRGA